MKVSFMRRIVLFCGLLLTLQIASSQSVQVSREDFDGNPNFLRNQCYFQDMLQR